jgi:transposase-like protein
LIQEAFINGVSTRRIERLAKAIGIENISAAQVSEITKGLEDQMTSFRTRALEEEYPFLCQDYEKRFPEAVRCLEEGLEDSLQFFGFPEIDDKKISSTNMPERTSREVRRRSRVIGVFPTVDS